MSITKDELVSSEHSLLRVCLFDRTIASEPSVIITESWKRHHEARSPWASNHHVMRMSSKTYKSIIHNKNDLANETYWPREYLNGAFFEDPTSGETVCLICAILELNPGVTLQQYHDSLACAQVRTCKEAWLRLYDDCRSAANIKPAKSQ